MDEHVIKAPVEDDGSKSPEWMNDDFYDTMDAFEEAETTQKQTHTDEVSDDRALNHSNRNISSSLFDQFRGNTRILSVSDITAPRWCEVQYEYKLLGQSHLPVDNRPSEITTASGAKIALNKNQAKTNDQIVESGRDVHTKLEHEIFPDVLFFQVISEVDRVGFRFLKMLIGINTLIQTGKTREMPVLGFVDNQLVYGIIDEIQRKPINSTPKSKAKSNCKAATTENSSNKSIDFYFTSTTKTRHPHNSTKKSQKKKVSQMYNNNDDENNYNGKEGTHIHYENYLIDTKTRHSNNSIPSDSQSQITKYQLFLYKKLFDQLASSQFQNDRFPEHEHEQSLYNHLNINPTDSFSQPFLHDLSKNYEDIIIGSGHNNNNNNNNNEEKEGEGTKLLNIKCVKDLYRLLTHRMKLLGKLNDVVQVVYRKRKNVLITRIQSRSSMKRKKNTIQQSSYKSGDEEEEEDFKRIIATKSFTYNQNALNEFIKTMLDFWNGKRKPVGVSVDETWKCRLCEFSSGCEWLKQENQKAVSFNIAKMKKSSSSSKNSTLNNKLQLSSIIINDDEQEAAALVNDW